MVRNPERRAALLDAAVGVLAREGARGLTFRAVDAEAGVPVGTASNYFADRDALLHQIDARLKERLTPDPAVIEELLASPKDRTLVMAFMRDLLARVTGDRTGYLAHLELRLEATRRPALHASYTESVRGELEFGMRFHREADSPAATRPSWSSTWPCRASCSNTSPCRTSSTTPSPVSPPPRA